MEEAEAAPSAKHLHFVYLQALEDALNRQSASSSQQPPGQGNFGDATNNLRKQELLTQIAVLKEQVGHVAEFAHSSTAISLTFPKLVLIVVGCR